MTSDLLKHLRVLEPQPGILAFYDGRIAGQQYSKEPNWIDSDAFSLGIASYAIVRGHEAIVYDTHITVPHAQFIRDTLAARGMERFTVVLSHWHLDHVAGTEAFADCPIIANRKTFEHLRHHKDAIESGTRRGPPAINPLVLPDTLFEGRREMLVGDRRMELIEANIHSDDATVIWIPDLGVLLAGDTMEDTVTYVGDPAQFDTHLADLDRLAELKPDFILPNHGDPEIIAAGGYDVGLVKAQQQYIRMLKRCHGDATLREQPLEELIAGPLSRGWVGMFEPYRAVHKQNLERVLEVGEAPWLA